MNIDIQIYNTHSIYDISNLLGNLDQKNGNWILFEILLSRENEDTALHIKIERITRIFNNMEWEEDKFLSGVDHMFDKVKTDFCSTIPSQPFKIMISIWGNRRLEEEIEEESEKESEEESEEPIIKTNQTFKSDECVLCLTNSPNVLFCNCGHLSVCVECDEVEGLDVCPICKTENYIKRVVE